VWTTEGETSNYYPTGEVFVSPCDQRGPGLEAGAPLISENALQIVWLPEWTG